MDRAWVRPPSPPSPASSSTRRREDKRTTATRSSSAALQSMEAYALRIHQQLQLELQDKRGTDKAAPSVIPSPSYARRAGVPRKPSHQKAHQQLIPPVRAAIIPSLRHTSGGGKGTLCERTPPGRNGNVPRKRGHSDGVPSTSSNQWTSVALVNTRNDQQEDDDNDDENDAVRRIHAGVYVVESIRSGHCVFGTTWDLRNAAIATMAALQDGSHAHAALVAAALAATTGSSEEGVRFRVVERVVVAPTSVGRPGATKGGRVVHDPAFDVRVMETRLAQRLRFHEGRARRHAASLMVRLALIRPRLYTWMMHWKDRVECDQLDEQLAASLTIEAAGRRRDVVRSVNRRRRTQAARCLQRSWRSFTIRNAAARCVRHRRCKASAVILQRALRVWLRWRRQHRLCCAVTLQRVMRGCLARCEAERRRVQQKTNRARCVLQRVARGYLARRFVACMQQRRVETSAVVKIQALWRSVVSQHQVAVIRRQRRQLEEEEEEEERRYVFAAKRIQMAFRRSRQLRYDHTSLDDVVMAAVVDEEKEAMELKEEAAARVLQRHVRGFRCRRQHAAEKANAEELKRLKQLEAVQVLQRQWRQYRCQQHRQRQRLANLQLQVEQKQRLESAARRIQTWYRAVVESCRRRIALRVASEIRLRHAAVGTLQRSYRCRLARREWRRRVALARSGDACASCGMQVADFFTLLTMQQLCSACLTSWHTDQDTDADLVLPLVRARALRISVALVENCFQRLQTEWKSRHGTCGLCAQLAVRVRCRSCKQSASTSLCHSCDILFHASTHRPHERIGIERFVVIEKKATVIQTAWRRHIQRHTLAKLQMARRTVAACVIQRQYAVHRRRLGFILFQALRRERYEKETLARRLAETTAAARVLQRVMRYWSIRQRWCLTMDALAAMHSHQQQMQVAATKLQSQYRRLQTQSVASKRRRAVIRIQRQARRRTAVTRYAVFRKAVIILQRGVRRWLRRRRITHEQHLAATVLQCAVRRRQAVLLKTRFVTERAQLQYQQKREAAVKEIQRLMRGVLARRGTSRLRVARARAARLVKYEQAVALEDASARRVQRVVRRRMVSYEFVRHRVAAQCAGRMWLARKERRRLAEEKRAAVYLQRAIRYWRVKQKLTRLVGMESEVVVKSGGSAWAELLDEASGYVYYYNRDTGETSWTPPGAEGEETDQEEQPEWGSEAYGKTVEWVQYWDESVGAAYYYNVQTGEATWAAPEGVDVEYGSWGGEEEDGNQVWPPGAPVQQDMHWQGNQGEAGGSDYAYGYGYGYEYGYDGSYGYGYGYDGGPPEGYDKDSAYGGEAAGNNTMQAHEDGEQQQEGRTTVATWENEDDTPVDTEYDINYQILLATQQQQLLQQQQPDESQQGEDESRSRDANQEQENS